MISNSYVLAPWFVLIQGAIFPLHATASSHCLTCSGRKAWLITRGLQMLVFWRQRSFKWVTTIVMDMQVEFHLEHARVDTYFTSVIWHFMHKLKKVGMWEALWDFLLLISMYIHKSYTRYGGVSLFDWSLWPWQWPGVVSHFNGTIQGAYEIHWDLCGYDHQSGLILDDWQIAILILSTVITQITWES